MGLRSVTFKKAYSSDSESILEDFYIPALAASVRYSRLAGFFSSTSLAIAARGVLGLIRNGGTLRLVVSPRLTEEDLDTIIDSYERRGEHIERAMLAELAELEDEFVRDHVGAFGWMIANRRLDIKVAIAHDSSGRPLSCGDIERSGLFHQKVGILTDSEGNIVTFSGSVNETAAGWLENIEEFKVFRSWEPSEAEYVQADISKFDRFWGDRSQRVEVMDVPRAVEERLIEIAPTNIEMLELDRWRMRLGGKRLELWEHQREAVQSWVDNGMRGIFEMATGTGKTFAALGCLDGARKSFTRLATIIACPYQHLVSQWEREIEKFGISYDKLIIADSSNPAWKNILADSFIDLSLGHMNNLVVLTTHRTFGSKALMTIVRGGKAGFTTLLIADEVHGLGAEKTREGLIDDYDLRLGLSATPKRWFDTAGTKAILDHLGETIYRFPLDKAINTINPATGQTYLTPYRYVPHFVSLTSDEIAEYVAKTRMIARLYGRAKNEEEQNQAMETLVFKRADIVKAAAEKYDVLQWILDQIGPSLKWTIIYCGPQQIDTVMEIINVRGLITHRFTMDEGTTPDTRYGGRSERDFLLEEFAEGKYQVLVAMRCLDEGVDVPPARTSILMASSGNPREYVQRIGRVIRRYPGKTEATVHDILVVPSFTEIPPDLWQIESRIFEKELARCEEIAATAINSAEALSMVYDVKNHLMEAKK